MFCCGVYCNYIMRKLVNALFAKIFDEFIFPNTYKIIVDMIKVIYKNTYILNTNSFLWYQH